MRSENSTSVLLLELDETGTIYTLVAQTAEDPFEDHWETIRLILAEAPQKLTRLDILMEWPADFDQPIIAAAIIYDAKGQKFAAYHRSGVTTDDPLTAEADGERI